MAVAVATVTKDALVELLASEVLERATEGLLGRGGASVLDEVIVERRGGGGGGGGFFVLVLVARTGTGGREGREAAGGCG